MDKLNDKQQIAVNHLNGPMLVLSGPGSGKTTVIVNRVKNLIEKNGILPRKILVITFSKSASIEMKNRFSLLTDDDTKYMGVTFTTFHAYFYRIIRRFLDLSNHKIIYEDEKKQMIIKILADLKIFAEDYSQIDNIINEISIIKNESINLYDFDPKSIHKSDFINIFNKYEEEKENSLKIDFDDMLFKCYNLILENEDALLFCQKQFDYVLIDEFQDINKVQYDVIKNICSHNNIFAVGDDDQSIYRFRGSNPSFLLNFKNDFENTEVVISNVNYRSTDGVIKLANFIIKNNKKRFDKKIIGTNKAFVNPKYITLSNPKDEAKFICDKIISLNKEENISYEDMAVIFRTNLQARALVQEMIDRNIKFTLKDIRNTVYDHFAVKDIINYLKASINIYDNESVSAIFNKPNRYISRSIITSFKEQIRDSESLIEVMSSSDILKRWQSDYINKLYQHLRKIKTKKPYDAIKYIRRNVGYDDYIEEISDKRKISKLEIDEILDEIQESSRAFSDIEEFLQNIEDVKEKTKNNQEDVTDGVILTTMHQSKGLEFSVVFVCGLSEGIIPHKLSKSFDEIEEERRLFYVAVTRAKKYLFLSSFKSRFEHDMDRTRFLDFLK